MILETARLRLRRPTPADLDDYYREIYSDPEVMRYLPGGVPRTREQTQAVIAWALDHAERHGFTLWAVEEQASRRFFGHCGLIYITGTEEVEVAYAFGRAHWGRGIATEAAGAALRYGFETAQLPAILALAWPANLASQRVMQKIGMRPMGLTDRYYDETLALYQLDRADYQPGGAPYRLLP